MSPPTESAVPKNDIDWLNGAKMKAFLAGATAFVLKMPFQ